MPKADFVALLFCPGFTDYNTAGMVFVFGNQTNLFTFQSIGNKALASMLALANHCSLQDSQICSYSSQCLDIKDWQNVLLLETLWYLNIKTRFVSELFSNWATRSVASAWKRVFGAPMFCQGFTDLLLFFTMPVHQELTRCASTWNFMVFEYWNQIKYLSSSAIGQQGLQPQPQSGFWRAVVPSRIHGFALISSQCLQ